MTTNRNNLDNLYTLANQDDLAGLQWYAEHQTWIQETAGRLDLPFEHLAAAVAILSPGVPWSKLCERLEGWVTTGQGMPGYQANLRKARQALAGDLSVVRGPKVQAFYANLCGDYSQVTVDRWAYRAWLGELGAVIPSGKHIQNHYKKIAADYQEAAAAVGLLPAHYQAVVWNVARRLAGEVV